MDAKKRMEELYRLLAYHNERYYNQDEPEISDYEYDQLSLELRRLEAEYPLFVHEDSVTQRVGGTARRDLRKVEHDVPVISLQDVFSKEEVFAFVERVKREEPKARFVVEKKIDGREFSVSVLGNEALPSVEILPKSGVYDFQSKYVSGMTDEICPGRLSASEESEIGRLALTAHRALGLCDYSRSDFIYGDGKFYYLETNALPGLTLNSLLPKAARAVGIPYGELCEKICALALERKKK